MENKDKQVLNEIDRSLKAILYWCKDCLSFEDFENSGMRVNVCAVNLIKIYDLADKISFDEIRIKIINTICEYLYNICKKITDGYSGVNMRIVWETINNDLKPLKAEIERYL